MYHPFEHLQKLSYCRKGPGCVQFLSLSVRLTGLNITFNLALQHGSVGWMPQVILITALHQISAAEDFGFRSYIFGYLSNKTPPVKGVLSKNALQN